MSSNIVLSSLEADILALPLCAHVRVSGGPYMIYVNSISKDTGRTI